MTYNPQVILHRAGGFLAPENTIEAMQIGVTLPVEGIEIDVSFTKDHIPVVYHDRSLKRTTGLHRPIRKMNYLDIRDLDNGSWFDPAYSHAKIPTLKQFLTTFKRRKLLYLEVKESDPKLLLIPKLISEQGMMDTTIFLSFHFQALLDIKETYPEATIMFLLGAKWKRSFSYTVDPRMDWYGLSFQLAHKKPQLVTRLLEHGYKINIWSCNDMTIADQLIKLGITSITTDKPQEMLDHIKSSLPR